MDNSVYMLAIGANLSFAFGSIFFTHYSRSISSKWVNFYKASVALVCFGALIMVTRPFSPIELKHFLAFFFSGVIGLGIGDIFLLKSFSLLGPGRTLMIFGFQPLILGTASYFIFNQGIDAQKFWAILCFILCLFIFSFESFKKEKSWQIKAIGIALIGMSLDAIGIIVTRFTFDQDTSYSSAEANFYRCFGAVMFFSVLSMLGKMDLKKPFLEMKRNSRIYLTIGCLFGTFISLALFLKAVQSAHLASLSGVAITGTIFSSMFECIYEKKWPSIYLIVAFLVFLVGMRILLA